MDQHKTILSFHAVAIILILIVLYYVYNINKTLNAGIGLGLAAYSRNQANQAVAGQAAGY